MVMETISRRAYAKHRGVSESAVRKAIATERISLEPDGKIDPVKADAEWEKNTAESGKSTAKKKTKPKPKKTAAVQEEKAEIEPDPLPEEEREDDEVDDSEVGDEEPSLNNQTSYSEARTANEILKAQTQKLKLAELKNELINRKRVIAHVFRLARDERDAWQRWPSRISAEMSSQLNVDQHELHTLLEKYVRQHLAELSEIKPQFD